MKLSDFNIYEILQLAIIVILPIAIYIAFSSEAIADAGYKELIITASFLRSIGAIEYIKLLDLILAIISSILLYFSLARFIEKKAIAFFVTFLFIVSPLIAFNISLFLSFITIISVFLCSISFSIFAFADNRYRFLSLIPLIAALFLSSQIFDVATLSLNVLSAFSSLGLILPLSFLFLVFEDLRKKDLLVAFFVVLLLTPFSPSFSLVVLSFYAALGFTYLLKTQAKTDGWLALCFFVAFYLGLLVSNLTTFVIVGGGVVILAYFFFSLRIITPRTATVFSLFFIAALASSITFVRLESDKTQMPSKELISMFQSAIDGDVGVLEFPNAFKFYAGKEAKMITREDLLSNKSLDVDYLIFSTDSLYRIFENSSIVLKFFAPINPEKNYGYNAVFGNRGHELYVSLSSDYSILPEPQPILTSLSSTYTKKIAFSKLKPFSSSLPLIDRKNVLINLEQLTNTELYNILIRCDVVNENNTTKIYRVC